MLRVCVAAGVLLLAAGCGSGASASDPSASAAPAPPADGGSFSTPADIMAKAGSLLPCADASPITPIDAKAQSMCDSGDVVVVVYEDHSGVDEAIATLGLASDAWLLTGENWSINAPKATLDAAKAKLGGQLVYVKCDSHC